MFSKIIILTTCLFTFAGCSTLRGSITAGSLIGGSLGTAGGAIFSPNKNSTPGNALVFGALGAGAGAFIAHYFFTNDPENRDLKQMMVPELAPINKKGEESPLFDFNPELKNIKPDLSFKPVKKYEVPIEALPESLKGKVKKQYLLEYEAESKTIQYEGKTIEVGPFKAYEHVYEE